MIQVTVESTLLVHHHPGDFPTTGRGSMMSQCHGTHGSHPMVWIRPLNTGEVCQFNVTYIKPPGGLALWALGADDYTVCCAVL